jgi:hypothetical protein
VDVTYGRGALVRLSPRWRLGLGVGLIGAVAYVCMDTWPLYSENQNTKFLYGLAKADVGRLKDDWLIAQGSELPIFDAFVYLCKATLGDWFFYVCHFGIVTTLAASLYGIARVVGLTNPDRFGPEARWFLPVFGIWFILFSTSHATLKFFMGVANQSIDAHVFQPQSFGVLSLLGLLLFRLGETGWAVVLIVAAAWIHPAYAIPGLMILLGMTVARMRFGTLVHAPWAVIGGGVVGCLSAAGFAYSLLQPSNPDAHREALRIITEMRIPEHSWPEIWFGEDAIYRIAGLCLVLWLARRDPLGWVLGTMAAAIAALTLWVYVTHDTALALAAPWRASAIAIPAGVAILFGRMSQWAADWAYDHTWRRQAFFALGAVALAVGVVAGVQNRIEFFRRLQEEPAYYGWVRENARDGDLFLTSTGDEDFRLATGQPQYVNWKSHPHRGEAVLEWYERTKKARAAIEPAQPSCELLTSLAGDGVTHLVRQTAQPPLTCEGWRRAYGDDTVTVFSTRF